jgi:hypothetical protein
VARAVQNVIFDLGGVVLDWNPDHIVSRFQPVPELQASLKAALATRDAVVLSLEHARHGLHASASASRLLGCI